MKPKKKSSTLNQKVNFRKKYLNEIIDKELSGKQGKRRNRFTIKGSKLNKQIKIKLEQFSSEPISTKNPRANLIF